ncbi:MAG: hypothetical protein JSU08_14285 [Acidobacteria bacterium]|nr:hypothetical protein [Acidobacteriota bacterium]
MRARLLVTTLCLVLGIPVAAQVRRRPTENGPWRPWEFIAIASARQARGASAAEVQAWQARLQAFGAVVRQSPAVAQPVGFAASLWGNLDGYGPAGPGEPAGKDVPLAGSLSFAAFPLIEFMRNGRLMNEDMKGGETATLGFAINEIDRSVFRAPMPTEWSGQDVRAFVEPIVGEPFAGLPRLDDVFVLKKNAKPLWVPFSTADALQPVITGRREAYEHARAVYAKEQAEFVEWQTPAKRAARRADWQAAAASIPNGAEFLANMEKSDVEIEKARRARLAPGGPEERGVAEAERDLKEAEAVLASLSPEQRSQQGCYAESGRTLAEKFRPIAGTAPAGCRPLVKTNWDYFDRRLPRTSAQVLVVTRFARCLTPEALAEQSPGGCVTNRTLMESIDWDAIRGLMDK